MDILLDKSKFGMEPMFHYFFQCDIKVQRGRNPNSFKIQSSRLHMTEFFEIRLNDN